MPLPTIPERPRPSFGAVPENIRRMYKLRGDEGSPTNYATSFLRREHARFRSETMAGLQGLPGQIYVYTGRTGNAGYKTIDSMMDEFEAMPFKQKRDLAKVLAMAGYLGNGTDLQKIVDEATHLDLAEAYEELLATAASRFANGQDITPDEILEMNVRYNLGALGIKNADELSLKKASKLFDKLGDGEAGKPQTIKTEQVSRDIWNPEDARALARQTLQQALGRDPSEEEYEDFIATLQNAQRNNPTITEQTSRYDAEGNLVRQSSTSTGGVNEEMLAQEYAENRPDWAEWQAVGTYFPALMQSLGSVVPGA